MTQLSIFQQGSERGERVVAKRTPAGAGGCDAPVNAQSANMRKCRSEVAVEDGPSAECLDLASEGEHGEGDPAGRGVAGGWATDPRPAAKQHDPEQSENLARVSGNIAEAILKFARRRLASRIPEFSAAELHAAVPMSAPASADRVLRDLRRRGKLHYEVTNRAASLYRLSFVVQP
jgi:hypothetical protein